MAQKDDRKARGASKQISAVVDRIEDGGMAVLSLGDDGKVQLDIPASLLPEGIEGGDHLRINISVDKSSRTGAEDRIKKLQAELKQQSGTQDKKDFKL